MLTLAIYRSSEASYWKDVLLECKSPKYYTYMRLCAEVHIALLSENMSDTTINLVIYYNHQTFDVDAMLDDPVETLAAQIESMTQLATKSQTLIVEDDILVPNRILRSYNLAPHQMVVVLGTNTIAANPKEKLSDAMLQRFEAP